MNDATRDNARESSLLLGRLALGLSQGLALYGLLHGKQAEAWLGLAHLPLLLMVVLLPPLWICALAPLPQARLWRGLAAQGVLLALIGAHLQWLKQGAGADGLLEFSELLGWGGAVLLVLIGWPLLLAGVREARWRASYPAYFDSAWRFYLQLVLAGMFCGAFWLVLALGAGLFAMIGQDFLSQLIGKPAFALPATTVSLAAGLHLSEVRPRLVAAIRQLSLTLLAWLLPLLAWLCAGFLLMLLAGGLQPLWDTRRATPLLLGAVLVLVLLINAAYQAGEHDTPQPRLLQLSARLGAALLLPLTLLAGYALWLRVAQYGWTPERVLAAAGALLALGYALGYARAALARQVWLAQLPGTNVALAWALLGVLVLLNTPLLSPLRIAVGSQLARLEGGVVAADKFDYVFLRFDAERYGREALQQLKGDGRRAAGIRERAAAMLARNTRWEEKPMAMLQLRDNLQLIGTGELPAEFVAEDWNKARNSWNLPDCLKRVDYKCKAVMGAFTGAQAQELLVADSEWKLVLFARQANGRWLEQGNYHVNGACPADLAALARGDFKRLPPRQPDLQVGVTRLSGEPFDKSGSCAAPR